MRMTSGDTWVSVEAMTANGVDIRVGLKDEAAMDIDLNDADLELAYVDEHSAEAMQTAVWSVGALGGAGGLTALVAVLRAFWRRHDGKTVTVETMNGDKFTVTGFSPATTERLIQEIKADLAEAARVLSELEDPPA